MKPFVDKRCNIETMIRRKALMFVLLDYEHNKATIFRNAIHLVEKVEEIKIHKENLDIWLTCVGGMFDGQSTQINEYFKGFFKLESTDPLSIVHKMAEFEMNAMSGEAEEENEYGMSGDWWK
jgi:hypothetical protein